MDLVPEQPQEPPEALLIWDIFCHVIDNFGDVGVCWRLAADLAARGHTVRLWLDDSQALYWIAPGALQGCHSGVSVRNWNDASNLQGLQTLAHAQVWVEGFGCELPTPFVAARANAANKTSPPVWVNLEYLSAEPFVERCHSLPSPVMSGPAKGWSKHFFYPGFTSSTGGLLREPGLSERRRSFGSTQRRAFLQSVGLADRGEAMVSLFCYDDAPVAQLLAQLSAQTQPVHLLVTAGKASALVERALADMPADRNRLRVSFLPLISQTDFDALLWSCDMNFVRGEDSLVRALWSCQPFVWQIYPQEDGAHRAKLRAFLEMLDGPPQVSAWHAQWNSIEPWDARLALPLSAPESDSPAKGAGRPGDWPGWARAVAQQLADQSDLVSRLCSLVQAVSGPNQQQKTR